MRRGIFPLRMRTFGGLLQREGAPGQSWIARPEVRVALCKCEYPVIRVNGCGFPRLSSIEV